jgi:peptide/nickel transport system substrate-binding protein
MNRIASVLAVVITVVSAFHTSFASTLVETPVLLESVQNGTLPPVKSRIPARPHVVTFDSGFKPGKHGGQLRLLMGKQKDIRQLVIYGYARLIGYNSELELKADILESFEVVENRIFTLHLRKGHQWSDGHPFTSDDFRYYWEDIANNPELSRGGLAHELLIDGEAPLVEFPDLHTVRYSWSQPNPYFIPALAGARPLYIYKPAHYLRQFHKSYQSEERIAELTKQYSERNWMGVHVNKDRPYKATNPDLPTLQPWANTTYPPSERFIFKRNPYYHRIDSNGRQLPYIDSIAIAIASGKLVPAKTGADESDLQARYLRMDNYTFLRQAALRGNFNVRLWKTSRGAHIALFPNMNTNDETLRDLMRDRRFRRALSHAIHRHEVNQVVYFGLVQESNNTVLPESPLFRPEFQKASTEFNIDKANDLLDELGLTERDSRGVRLMADGRPLEILIQTAGESTEQTDVLQLIHDSWLAAGVKLYSVPSTREVFRNRIFSGDAVMSIWSGLPNGLPTADSNPSELAPTNQYQYQWPKWGLFYESSGKSGEKTDNPVLNELLELNHRWRLASGSEEREKIWLRMLEIHSEEIFTLGIINGVRHPVVVNNHLHNVPQTGFYDIQPGAYFGMYKPDTFWFDEERR